MISYACTMGDLLVESNLLCKQSSATNANSNVNSDKALSKSNNYTPKEALLLLLRTRRESNIEAKLATKAAT